MENLPLPPFIIYNFLEGWREFLQGQYVYSEKYIIDTYVFMYCNILRLAKYKLVIGSHNKLYFPLLSRCVVV